MANFLLHVSKRLTLFFPASVAKNNNNNNNYNKIVELISIPLLVNCVILCKQQYTRTRKKAERYTIHVNAITKRKTLALNKHTCFL